MKKLIEWLKANKWFVAAYVVFVGVFWFLGGPSRMTPLEAYLGTCLLHLVFAGLVWLARKILAV